MALSSTELWVSKTEASLGRRFPAALRTRYLAENGGEIVVAEDDWELFPIQDLSDRKRAARTAGHVVHETELARGWSEFPSDAVAIATNGCGDMLVLRPSPTDESAWADMIFIWNHETGVAQKASTCTEILG